MAEHESTALDADANDTNDFDVTHEAAERALAERRRRLAKIAHEPDMDTPI